jgi:hypothetical protein
MHKTYGSEFMQPATKQNEMRLKSSLQPHLNERESTVTKKNKTQYPRPTVTLRGCKILLIRKQSDSLSYISCY